MIFLLLGSFLAAEEQHTIEVYGKKIPLLFDSKRDVMIIKGEYLKQFPSLTIAELLSFTANMNFVSRGYFQADPQAMGFNQEQVLVMINGIHHLRTQDFKTLSILHSHLYSNVNQPCHWPADR